MLTTGVFILARVISAAFRLFELLILIRVIMSWVSFNPYSKWARMITDVTDPFLDTIADYLPRQLTYPLDFTPIVAILLLGILQRIVFRLLFLLV